MTSKLALALAFAVPIPASAGPVAWDFIVNTCPSCSSPGPQSIAELILDGPDSAGSTSLVDLSATIVQSGSPYYFWLISDPNEFISTSQPYGLGWAYGLPPAPKSEGIVSYSLAWNEVANVLTEISVSFLTEQDQILNLGLSGGLAGSDGTLDGCAAKLCAVTGEWIDAPVSEPSMWWLFGLAGLALAMWHQLGAIAFKGCNAGITQRVCNPD